MSPYVEVVSDQSATFTVGHDTAESPEAARGDFGQYCYAYGMQIGFIIRGDLRWSSELISQKFVEKLGMPLEIATALVQAGINKKVGFRVTCTTKFEEKGRIGGPRHYENYQIR